MTKKTEPDIFTIQEPLPSVPVAVPPPVQPINVLTASDTSTDLETAVRNAEKFVMLQDSIRKMAIKVTSVHDWIDEGGKPYLQEQGAQKIAMAFGVSIINTSLETEHKTDELGDWIIFTYSGDAVWQGRTSPQIGTGSTRDPFFGKRKGSFLPLSEVDQLNVKKKAMTNLLNRAIKSCLGLSYTWDELSEASGERITAKTVGGAGNQVSYDRGGQGGSTKPPETQKDKDKKTTMWDMMVEMYGSAENAGDALEKATAFTNSDGKEIAGKRDHTKVTIKQTNFLYTKVKKAYDDWIMKQP